MREARKRHRFQALVRPELDALFRTAWRIAGRRAVAEELAQEACVRAYAAFDVDDEPAAFRPWLFRILVNLALDHLRRCRHEVLVAHDDSAEVHGIIDPSVSGQPLAAVEGRDIGRALERALASISPELRAVTILVLIEEMSYAEAAVALDITADLVRSRLSRARADLRRILATQGADLSLPTARDRATTSAPAAHIKRGPQ